MRLKSQNTDMNLVPIPLAYIGEVAFDFVFGFIQGLSDEEQLRFTVCRSPRLEIEYEDGSGGTHFIRVIAADGKSALGSVPTLVLMDERGHSQKDQGGALAHALLSMIGKPNDRALIISNSAAEARILSPANELKED